MPLTPKAEDQIINMSLLHGYFLGPVLQSRELPDGFHLKGRVRKVKITQTQSQPVGTGSLEETPSSSDTSFWQLTYLTGRLIQKEIPSFI